MTELLTGQVMQLLTQVSVSYYRLVLVVGHAGTGKTIVLNEVSSLTGAPVINVNLELSRRMLELSGRQRSIRVPQLLNEISSSAKAEPLILDNIEILFDPILKQDPLRLLQTLSRNKTVLAAWNGSVKNQQIDYAVSDHPEYRRYQVRDFFVVTKEQGEVVQGGVKV